MPRVFDRIITFHVKGEIYDAKDTTPESILRNYNWSFRDNTDGTISVVGRHKDNRGRITKMIKLPKIHKYKQPDTEFFLKL